MATMTSNRMVNILEWLTFYKDACVCAYVLSMSPHTLRRRVLRLHTTKTFLGARHRTLSCDTDDARYIAETIWSYGWMTAVFGFAFCFGLFGTFSPYESLTSSPTSASLNPIRNRIYTKNNITCAICLSPFCALHETVALPHCDHYYHKECAEAWLRRSTSCPLCRRCAT
jgi:hypothetical protein